MTELHDTDVLRAELNQLLQKQSETLKSRVFGGVSDTELLEYDLGQEVICEIQERPGRKELEAIALARWADRPQTRHIVPNISRCLSSS
jgi:hypothetical protein